jgi:iron-sulfur cluster assembly protein
LAALQEERTVELTEAAAKRVAEILKQSNKSDHSLRIFVRGGGCSGFSYGMSVEKSPTPDDIVVEDKGVKVLVDKYSAEYLHGSTVDYVESLQSSGFKIENPNAVQSCGCGQSFRTTAKPGTPRACSH